MSLLKKNAQSEKGCCETICVELICTSNTTTNTNTSTNTNTAKELERSRFDKHVLISLQRRRMPNLDKFVEKQGV